MKLESLMRTDVTTVSPKESAQGAYQLMGTKRCHHLIVVDDSGVSGVVSERDLGGPKGEDFRKGRTVEDLMSRDPVSATTETTLHEAAELMRGRSIGCLPIMQGKRLIGIVTTSDLLKVLSRSSS